MFVVWGEGEGVWGGGVGGTCLLRGYILRRLVLFVFLFFVISAKARFQRACH